jgi:hypothetical protein
MAKLNDLEDVSISNPKVGDVVKYTATGWQNAADATGTPAGGNPCGDLDGYTQNDKEEIITEPWTWEDAGCPSITVKDAASQSAEVCAHKYGIKQSGVEGEFKLDNGNVKLTATGSELYFSDSAVTGGVRLAELIAGSGGGGSNTATFNPIIMQFEVDEANSVKTNTQSWSLINSITASFSFGLSWADLFPDGRAFNVIVSKEREIAMPTGANAAIVFYQTQSEFGAGYDPELNPAGSQRALHVAHRLEIENATFPINTNLPTGVAKVGFGAAFKSNVTLPSAEQTVVERHVNTQKFNKCDLINFANNAVLKLKPRVDVLKGGRGRFNCSAGRVLIFPFYSASPSDFTLPDIGGDDGFYFSSEDDLNAIYDEISPAETPAESAFNAGTEYRDILRRIIVSLESRKSYPPAGGATEAEFDSQIQAAWELADNSTLQTIDEFKAAFLVYYTEVTKEKYGIAVLFQFEIEAGNTLRGLL